MADGVVRFVGEPVAVVAADSPYLAEDALGAIALRLSPLPVAADPRQDDAPVLHPDGPNVLFDNFVETGAVTEAFEQADVVIERSFRNPRYSAAPMEPRAVLAMPDGDGIRIWSSTQIPHVLARVTAELLEMPREKVRVTVPSVGGGFGQKAHAYPEEILVAWLTRELKRPVKWIEDRNENLLASSHARDQFVTVRLAADRDGRLLALDADVVCDIGAYGVYPHGPILEALGTPAMIPGPYRLERYRARSRSVATNKCPEGAYRGVGLPVSALVHERMMDVLAGETGIDRAEVRRRNLITSDELPYTTVSHQQYDSGDYLQALERALDAVGYAEFEAERAQARAAGQDARARAGLVRRVLGDGLDGVPRPRDGGDPGGRPRLAVNRGGRSDQRDDDDAVDGPGARNDLRADHGGGAGPGAGGDPGQPAGHGGRPRRGDRHVREPDRRPRRGGDPGGRQAADRTADAGRLRSPGGVDRRPRAAPRSRRRARLAEPADRIR